MEQKNKNTKGGMVKGLMLRRNKLTEGKEMKTSKRFLSVLMLAAVFMAGNYVNGQKIIPLKKNQKLSKSNLQLYNRRNTYKKPQVSRKLNTDLPATRFKAYKPQVRAYDSRNTYKKPQVSRKLNTDLPATRFKAYKPQVRVYDPRNNYKKAPIPRKLNTNLPESQFKPYIPQASSNVATVMPLPDISLPESNSGVATIRQLPKINQPRTLESLHKDYPNNEIAEIRKVPSFTIVEEASGTSTGTIVPVPHFNEPASPRHLPSLNKIYPDNGIAEVREVPSFTIVEGSEGPAEIRPLPDIRLPEETVEVYDPAEGIDPADLVDEHVYGDLGEGTDVSDGVALDDPAEGIDPADLVDDCYLVEDAVADRTSRDYTGLTPEEVENLNEVLTRLWSHPRVEIITPERSDAPLNDIHNLGPIRVRWPNNRTDILYFGNTYTISWQLSEDFELPLEFEVSLIFPDNNEYDIEIGEISYDRETRICSADWTVPSRGEGLRILSGEYKIKVSAGDESDTSDNPFFLTDIYLAVHSPDSPLRLGSEMRLLWVVYPTGPMFYNLGYELWDASLVKYPTGEEICRIIHPDFQPVRHLGQRPNGDGIFEYNWRLGAVPIMRSYGVRGDGTEDVRNEWGAWNNRSIEPGRYVVRLWPVGKSMPEVFIDSLPFSVAR